MPHYVVFLTDILFLFTLCPLNFDYNFSYGTTRNIFVTIQPIKSTVTFFIYVLTFIISMKVSPVIWHPIWLLPVFSILFNKAVFFQQSITLLLDTIFYTCGYLNQLVYKSDKQSFHKEAAAAVVLFNVNV